MAKKIMKRPQDIYTEKYQRACKHGWRCIGTQLVEGKNYVKMVRTKRVGDALINYHFIGISAVNGKTIAIRS